MYRYHGEKLSSKRVKSKAKHQMLISTVYDKQQDNVEDKLLRSDPPTTLKYRVPPAQTSHKSSVRKL